MQLTQEKKEILLAVSLCKKRTVLLKEQRKVEEMQSNLLPMTDNKYLAIVHMKKHPLTLLKLIYWIFVCFVCVYTVFPSLKVFFQNFSVSIPLPELMDIIVDGRSDYLKASGIFVLALIMYIVWRPLRLQLLKKKYLPAARQNMENLTNIKQYYQNLSNELKELEHRMLNPHNCIIPPKYWDAAEKIEEYIVNLRANTITDALNLYETERYRAYNLTFNATAAYRNPVRTIL